MTKRALVTGASGGIGKAFARSLAHDGYRLTLVSRNRQKLEEVRGLLAGEGHEVIAADLSDPVDITRVANHLRSERYQLLINNAGVGVYGVFKDTDLQRLMKMQRLNCDAVIELSYVFLEHSTQGDALINVSSVLGLLPLPTNALYSATKALVISLSVSLWRENRDRGVYVMGLCPGATQTDFFSAAGGDTNQPPPDALMETPDQVVETAMKALKKRNRPVVVSGGKNRAFVNLSRFMSLKAVANTMMKFTPKT